MTAALISTFPPTQMAMSRVTIATIQKTGREGQVWRQLKMEALDSSGYLYVKEKMHKINKYSNHYLTTINLKLT